MDCVQFAEQIEELALGGQGAGDGFAHARTCEECAALLGRARRIVRLVESRPIEDPPSNLREQVRTAAFSRRSIGMPRLVRAAAALVLFAACGLATFLVIGRTGADGPESDRGYEPLQVRVVKIQGNGALEQTFALEGVYGPDAAMLVADGGEPDNTDGR